MKAKVRRGSDLLDSEVTVLLTSVGNEAIHGFASDLRAKAPRWQLVGVDSRPDAPGLYLCDHRYTVPRRDSPDFLEILGKVINRHQADILLPLSTEDQSYFARPGVREELPVDAVLTSPPEAVASANSKIGAYRALSEHPNILPNHEVVQTPRQAITVLERMVELHGAALMKADRGTGGVGLLCVGSPPAAESAPAANRVWWPLPAIASLARGSDPELVLPEPLSLLTAPRTEADWPRIVTQYLPGEEYSVDLLADRGESISGVVRLRHRAIGGLATSATTVEAPDVWRAAKLVATTLGLSYVNNIQFRRDGEGNPRLIDINPRIPGTISLTVESGLNLPLAACCMGLGATIDLPPPRIGVHVLRYFGNVFTSVLAAPFDRD